MENKINYLFTDGSVNPKTKIGFGAYLHVKDNEPFAESLMNKVYVKKFIDTSSTKLEVETILWALKALGKFDGELIVFTDCQNVLGLELRREKFEQNDYLTSKGKLIRNHELYKEFYKIIDSLKCKFVKVKGHKPKGNKDNIDDFFTLVDKTSRNALRKYYN